MTIMTMIKKSAWSVADAKARFSELIELALTQGPQAITRRGREAVMVVSAEDWKRQTARKGSFLDFMKTSPLRGSGVRIERQRDRPRKIEL
jgi:prevent-host-death family protein